MGLIELNNQVMKLVFNQRRGTLQSLKLLNDRYATEFIGNAENISYQSIHERNQWTGDVKIRTWDESQNQWTLELTERSGDIRESRQEDNGDYVVEYRGDSRNENGIVNVFLKQRYTVREDAVLLTLGIKNITAKAIEVGEVSLPFVTNTDFYGIFEDKSREEEDNWRGIKQKIWHEERVQSFMSVNGSSSYVLLQRPKGDYPALVFQTMDGTGLEVAYQMDSQIGGQWTGSFEGPYYLSLYSKAPKICEQWKWNYDKQSVGLNGSSSMMLAAGEERSFNFRFKILNEMSELGNILYEAGQLAVDVSPGMVVPVGESIKMRLRCRDEVKLIPVANNFAIKKTGEKATETFWKIDFSQTGQKKVRVEHGSGVTNLFFYAVGEIKQLLKSRAGFIIDRQYYENPQDPFNRHHAFLGFDDMVEMLFTEGEETFQVAGADEHGLPIPMFLAEKNVHYPNQREIDVLEEYIDDCLYGIIQQRDTYYVKRSLYYEEKKPSDKLGFFKFDKAAADGFDRTFNYPLISNIYFSMYQIGKAYQMTKKRTAAQYLEMAYKTRLVGFQIGENMYTGAPAGATVTELLTALKEDNPEGYRLLDEKTRAVTEENVNSEYPFGSEVFIDQTPHNQYQAMMKYYGYDQQVEQAYRITMALRTGFQPAWFLYGNDKRGCTSCWYSTPLNSRVLYDGYEDTNDLDMLKLAYAGATTFMACIKSSGAAHGWYTQWPDRSGFDQRSLDTDMGLYGYLKAARAVVAEEPVFGKSGYGCRVTEENGRCVVTPYDGLGTRMYYQPQALELAVSFGRMERIEIAEEEKLCRVWVRKIQPQKEVELSFVGPADWQVVIEKTAN